MRKYLIQSACVIIASLAIASCRKDTTTAPLPGTGPIMGTPPIIDTAAAKRLYIMNTGIVQPAGYTDDSSTLAYYNIGTKQFTADQFLAVNGKPIGLTGNDVEIYGSKMYVTVTNSNVVDILDPRTGALLGQDSMINTNTTSGYFVYGKQPRYIAFYKENAYISCADGSVAIMDTLTFSTKGTITLPPYNDGYAEGVLVENGKLYVAESGFGITNTISVIDLATNKEIKKISVLADPLCLAADSYGNIYVASSYTDDFNMYDLSIGGLTVIDGKTDMVKTQVSGTANFEKRTLPLAVSGDSVFYAGAGNKIVVYNAKTQMPLSTSFVTDGTTILNPCSICVDHFTGEVYIGDAKDGASKGTIDVFDKTGKLEYAFPTGISPVRLRLLNF